jgi:hypothetical protein
VSDEGFPGGIDDEAAKTGQVRTVEARLFIVVVVGSQRDLCPWVGGSTTGSRRDGWGCAGSFFECKPGRGFLFARLRWLRSWESLLNVYTSSLRGDMWGYCLSQSWAGSVGRRAIDLKQLEELFRAEQFERFTVEV